VLDATDKAPALLNGNLGTISPLYWIGVLLFAAAIDFNATMTMHENDKGYFPGNLGFDPLGLYPKDEAGQRRMQLAEIKNGRLAMVAITGFAVQEFVTKLGVIDQTPIFFQPIEL
jgi:Chlorophyll A-B binding protein